MNPRARNTHHTQLLVKLVARGHVITKGDSPVIKRDLEHEGVLSSSADFAACAVLYCPAISTVNLVRRKSCLLARCHWLLRFFGSVSITVPFTLQDFNL